jgi:LacI family transcriptional regulator
MSQTALPEKQRLPILELDCHLARAAETLQRWINKNRPDAILTEVGELPATLKGLGFRVPEDIALAATSVLDGNVDAGIYQNSEEIGITAVTTLVSLIYQNQTGFPKLGRETLVDARWQDGDTLPQRAGFAVNCGNLRPSLVAG